MCGGGTFRGRDPERAVVVVVPPAAHRPRRASGQSSRDPGVGGTGERTPVRSGLDVLCLPEVRTTRSQQLVTVASTTGRPRETADAMMQRLVLLAGLCGAFVSLPRRPSRTASLRRAAVAEPQAAAPQTLPYHFREQWSVRRVPTRSVSDACRGRDAERCQRRRVATLRSRRGRRGRDATASGDESRRRGRDEAAAAATPLAGTQSASSLTCRRA